jgi:hypothetical protein
MGVHMRKDYSNYLRKSFEKRLKEEFPEFVIKKGEEYVSSGNRLYRYLLAPDFVLYIMLAVDDVQDAFTILIGHSINDKFPIPTPFFEPTTSPLKSNLVFKLGRLWTEKDVWWVVETTKESVQRIKDGSLPALPPEEYMPRVERHVEDVMDKLHRYAVPWFQKVAAHFGHDFATAC